MTLTREQVYRQAAPAILRLVQAHRERQERAARSLSETSAPVPEPGGAARGDLSGEAA